VEIFNYSRILQPPVDQCIKIISCPRANLGKYSVEFRVVTLHLSQQVISRSRQFPKSYFRYTPTFIERSFMSLSTYVILFSINFRLYNI